jgi:putative membrane protein
VNLFSQTLIIARLEGQFYVRYPKLLLAAVAVAFIPALYVVIYLSSVWDPVANSGYLPVGLVNQDQGVDYRGQVFNVGQEVTSKLKAVHTFGYVDYSDESEARQRVREGKLAFVLIVPRDFSSNAIPGAEAGGGRLTVYTSEGNSYQSAGLARRFAESLGHEVNERLNERRWALVLSNAVGSQRSVDRLREGANQLLKGAQELTAGTTQTAAGAESVRAGLGVLNQRVGQLTTGVKELGAGLRSMDARMPPGTELNQLKTGAETLAFGHAELSRGLVDLKSGAKRMKDGVSASRDEAKDSLFVSDRTMEGIDQLADGMSQLDSGLQAAIGAQKKLSEGADRVSSGVGTLTSGVSAMGTGIHSMVTKLPADSQMNELAIGSNNLLTGSAALADGTKKVKAGTQHMASGVDLLAGSLPATSQKMDGSAEGLANSVRPRVEVDAAVQNNGSGFAPNIIPAALWLGASIAAFLIHVRVLPREAKPFSRLAQVLGKIAIPSSVVLLQALLVQLAVLFVMNMSITHQGAFALTLGVASMTFLFIVFALTRAFGDAGKALALLFLAVQLSSSGGVLPVELSGGLFVDISPWLPLTWVVKAIKVTMFGAYGDAWLYPLMFVAAGGIAAAAMASTVGSWRYVDQASVRPAVDF